MTGDPTGDPSDSPPTADEVEGTPEPPLPRTAATFLGQVVERRSWPLIAIALAFGLLLAAAPLLFMAERSPFADALATYDALCTARSAGDVARFRAHLSGRSQAADAAALLAGFPCMDRTAGKPTFDPVAGNDPASGSAWVLTLANPSGMPIRLRFLREDDVVRWDPGVPGN